MPNYRRRAATSRLDNCQRAVIPAKHWSRVHNPPRGPNPGDMRPTRRPRWGTVISIIGTLIADGIVVTRPHAGSAVQSAPTSQVSPLQHPGSNGSPTTAVTFGGSLVDTHPYPHQGTTADPLFDIDIQHEARSVSTGQSWPTGLNSLFFVFTGSGIQSCFDSTRTSCSQSEYCAYHLQRQFLEPAIGGDRVGHHRGALWAVVRQWRRRCG